MGADVQLVISSAVNGLISAGLIWGAYLYLREAERSHLKWQHFFGWVFAIAGLFYGLLAASLAFAAFLRLVVPA